MDILDIFFWLPEKELSLEQIEKLVKDLDNGIQHKGYSVEYELPPGANENITNSVKELIEEGKQVCFLLIEKQIVSVVGYRR